MATLDANQQLWQLSEKKIIFLNIHNYISTHYLLFFQRIMTSIFILLHTITHWYLYNLLFFKCIINSFSMHTYRNGNNIRFYFTQKYVYITYLVDFVEKFQMSNHKIIIIWSFTQVFFFLQILGTSNIISWYFQRTLQNEHFRRLNEFKLFCETLQDKKTNWRCSIKHSSKY